MALSSSFSVKTWESDPGRWHYQLNGPFQSHIFAPMGLTLSGSGYTSRTGAVDAAEKVLVTYNKKVRNLMDKEQRIALSSQIREYPLSYGV